MARKTSSGPAWQVIVEEIRSQNRLTLEAVEGSRQALTKRMDRMDRDLRTRMAVLEDAIRAIDRDSRSRDAALEQEIRKLQLGLEQNTVKLEQNTVKLEQNTADVRELARRVEALARLEERVAALERRMP